MYQTMTSGDSKDRQRKRKKASMQDVADLAGVSRTTVSFVINRVEKGNIPAETQRRVWEAVKALQYRPNALARGLRAQKSNTIGFITDQVATTPYAGRVLQGAQDFAWQHEILLLTVNTDGNQHIKEAAVSTLLERQVDGIIYATMYHREVHPPSAISQVPVVLLDCFLADASLTSIVPDDYQGGLDAVEFLINKGHSQIGFVCDSNDVPAKRARMRGYRDALAHHNIPFNPDNVQYGISDPVGGEKAALALLDRQERPSAIFCYNDRMAMGAYDVARRLGLSIPDDLAIIGFDNHDVIAPYLNPSLTTMQLPHYEMGQLAVEELLSLMTQSESSHDPKQYKIPCPMVIRESV